MEFRPPTFPRLKCLQINKHLSNMRYDLVAASVWDCSIARLLHTDKLVIRGEDRMDGEDVDDMEDYHQGSHKAPSAREPETIVYFFDLLSPVQFTRSFCQERLEGCCAKAFTLGLSESSPTPARKHAVTCRSSEIIHNAAPHPNLEFITILAKWRHSSYMSSSPKPGLMYQIFGMEQLGHVPTLSATLPVSKLRYSIICPKKVLVLEILDADGAGKSSIWDDRRILRLRHVWRAE